jgi:hypothetical protein
VVIFQVDDYVFLCTFQVLFFLFLIFFFLKKIYSRVGTDTLVSFLFVLTIATITESVWKASVTVVLGLQELTALNAFARADA